MSCEHDKFLKHIHAVPCALHVHAMIDVTGAQSAVTVVLVKEAEPENPIAMPLMSRKEVEELIEILNQVTDEVFPKEKPPSPFMN